MTRGGGGVDEGARGIGMTRGAVCDRDATGATGAFHQPRRPPRYQY